MSSGRKKALIALPLVAAVVAVVLLASGGSGDKGYVVRGDLRQRLVHGQGRAGARRRRQRRRSRIGRRDHAGRDRPPTKTAGRKRSPGKAVIVMKITDPGFQDFRDDASCVIRPQSLIGEKYVDCRPTLPRAADHRAAPGAERDPRRPARRRRSCCCRSRTTAPRRPRPDQRHPDAALRAALPPDLQRTRRHPGRSRRPTSRRPSNAPTRTCATPTACSKSSPSRRTNSPSSPSDSEQVTKPLADQRLHVAGFFANAGAAGQATAERGAELEA